MPDEQPASEPSISTAEDVLRSTREFVSLLMARVQAMPTRWTLPLAALAVALGVVLRIVHRGPYAFGWEFVSAAQGLHDLATYTPRQLWALSIAHSNGVLLLPWNVRGLLTVVPGALTWL